MSFPSALSTNFTGTDTTTSLEDTDYTSGSPSWSITPTPTPLVMNGQSSSGECLENCDENYVSYLRFIAGTLILFLGVYMYFKCSAVPPRREEGNPNATPSPMADGPPSTTSRRNSSNRPGGMSSSQRNQFVTQFLPTKLFKASSRNKDNVDDWEPHVSTELSSLPHSENMPVSTISYGHNENENEENEREPPPSPVASFVTPVGPPRSIPSVDETLPVQECAVCLEAFCQNDEICTSNNPECPHVFHVKCMHSWLLRQEECPCCRRPYLQVDLKEEILF